METLHPRPVWAHFARLCAIPRPSCHEAAVRGDIETWARCRGYAARVDPAGNLILSRPASPGCEDRPGVILQGHLDMVCQADAGTGHDFHRDPIQARIRDGWVVAETTTLGADNGIGVALALAALDDPGPRHPALEVLLTVNEECGMDGARGLIPGTLRGRVLINLDSEEWGYFYLGCAGGIDVEVSQPIERVQATAQHPRWHLQVAGLLGGHSGLDIHRGRGNAIKILAGALRALTEACDFGLLELAGGSARNAIPREARAVIALPAASPEAAAHRLERFRDECCRRLAETDPGLTLTYGPDTSIPARAVPREARDRILACLADAFDGVAAMSRDFPDVVETSANLGVAELGPEDFRATFKVRSPDAGRAGALADALVAHAMGRGLAARKDGAYPGWQPDPGSPLLTLCQRVHAEHFGRPAGVRVIHAGLECGLLAASHPYLDMISFGPDIVGAHAPGERVEIDSVARCWDLLRAILGALAE